MYAAASADDPNQGLISRAKSQEVYAKPRAGIPKKLLKMLNDLSNERHLGGVIKGDIDEGANWARGDIIVMPWENDSEGEEMLWHVSTIVEVGATSKSHKVCMNRVIKPIRKRLKLDVGYADMEFSLWWYVRLGLVR